MRTGLLVPYRFSRVPGPLLASPCHRRDSPSSNTPCLLVSSRSRRCPSGGGPGRVAGPPVPGVAELVHPAAVVRRERSRGYLVIRGGLSLVFRAASRVCSTAAAACSTAVSGRPSPIGVGAFSPVACTGTVPRRFPLLPPRRPLAPSSAIPYKLLGGTLNCYPHPNGDSWRIPPSRSRPRSTVPRRAARALDPAPTVTPSSSPVTPRVSLGSRRARSGCPRRP